MPRRSPFAGSSDLVALGLALREARGRRGVQQEAVGFDAGLGPHYISMVELGYLNPAFLTLLAMARTLRIPLAELVEIYSRELERIDPDAGDEVPACPTPAALAHTKRVSSGSAAAYHVAKARRARSRMRSWT